MQKIQERQAQKLQDYQENLDKQYKKIFKAMIFNDEQIKIITEYCLKFYQEKQIDDATEYAAVNISRLIFKQQLANIKAQFDKLPQGKCRLQHFLIIMLKTMNFQFQKNPYYLIGLKDIFCLIKQRYNDYITYAQFFKYSLGEIINLEQNDQNTQFQVHFQQLKKQDYLLHDSGIVKILYSKDLKYYLALDRIAFNIKIYDNQMKIIAKFTPNKQKHSNKFPTILDFDYSQLSMKLGLLLSDNTLSIIHLGHFLKKNTQQFQSSVLNQIVYTIPQDINKLYFLQMTNTWISISQNNKVYVFHVDRLKQEGQEEIYKQIKIFKDPKEQLKVLQILQVVALSTICIITQNQILFYDESLAQKKYKKFVHCTSITNLKFIEEKNQFYLCGKEKIITIFKIHRNTGNFKIWTLQFDKLITQFQVFPHLNTVLIVDEYHNLSLYDEKTKFCYQTKNFQHIVKKKKKNIGIYKVTKSDFIIFESYMLILHQQKVAITKDVQYLIQENTYFDKIKEQLYISVNGQILGFSILNGQIRKSYTSQTSNLSKFLDFSFDKDAKMFIFDSNFSLYYIFGNDQQLLGENKRYKKEIEIEDFVKMEYDQNLAKIYIYCKKCIKTVQNHSKNNFSVEQKIIFQNFKSIIHASHDNENKKFNLLTSDNILLTLNSCNLMVQNIFKCNFLKKPQQVQETKIRSFAYDSYFNVHIIFTTVNQIYLFKPQDIDDCLYIDLTQLCPQKQKHLIFTKLKVQCLSSQTQKTQKDQKVQKKINNNNKKILYLLVTNQYGHLFEIRLDQRFLSRKKQIQIDNKDSVNFKATNLSRNKFNLNFKDIQNRLSQITLKKQNKFKHSRQNTLFLKAHDKEIMVMRKIFIQKMLTLSISKNGFIKLFDHYMNLFTIRLPQLIRSNWKMQDIQKIKIKKSINQTKQILISMRNIFDQQKSAKKILNQTKKIKAKEDFKKIDPEQPIPIQIQRKDIEDIVQNHILYSTQYNNKNRSQQHIMFRTQKVHHPWRTKKEFINIFQNSASTKKYKKQMPRDLLHLRKSLDMFPRKDQINPQKIEKQLKIIPQLKSYRFQLKQSTNESQNNFLEILNQKEEAFQSCFYVKSDNRNNKSKLNNLDQIDKEFKKKDMLLATRKPLVFRSPPKNRINKSMQLGTKKQEIIYTVNPNPRYDAVKQVLNIFEKHNKEVNSTKQGRLIRIPRLNQIKTDRY